MFGRQYTQHVDLLMHSFGQMNKDYLHKSNEEERITFIEKLKKLYILLFGIPEIGFQIRSIYFEKLLSAYIRDKKLTNILDAGSGIGAYTFLLGEMFPNARVTGSDIDMYKLKASRLLTKKLQTKNIKFIQLDITKNHKQAQYDFIITIDVLEHVKNYDRALINFFRLLKKRGYLYIHVPQPHQKRIFSSLRQWHHEDHVREGIDKKILENKLKQMGFNIIASRESFGFFGKLAWELNHIMLAKSFLLAGITFPFLYILAIFDQLWPNKNGLGIAVIAKKI